MPFQQTLKRDNRSYYNNPNPYFINKQEAILAPKEIPGNGYSLIQNKTPFQKKNLILKPLKILRRIKKPFKLLGVSTPKTKLLYILFSKLRRKSLQLISEEINCTIVIKWFKNRYPTKSSILVTENILYRIGLILFL